MTALGALRLAGTLLPATSLPEVLEAAALQTRVDRKYLLSPAEFLSFAEALVPSYRVLEMGRRRDFRYESVYFDTAALDSYLGAARGRRNKFKVRTRTYLDSGSCLLEVKLEGGRQETIKDRQEHGLSARDHLGHDGQDFVDERVTLDLGAGSLRPTLTTTYHRSTLVDLEAGARVTCDASLGFADPHTGARVEMLDHVLVETKVAGAAGDADRHLWRAGIRPVSISKYCVGMALLHPDLPSNKWRRVLRHQFADTYDGRSLSVLGRIT